jgi:hypothetical protein
MRIGNCSAFVIAFVVALPSAAQTATEIQQPSWVDFATTVLDEAQARIKDHRVRGGRSAN